LIPFEHFLLNPLVHAKDSTGVLVYTDEVPGAPDIIKELLNEPITITHKNQTGGAESSHQHDPTTLLGDLLKSTKVTPTTRFEHLMANEYKKIETSDEEHKYSRVEFYVNLFIYLYAAKMLLV
jgi:hypothetical protein